jgi:hypothetical protein
MKARSSTLEWCDQARAKELVGVQWVEPEVGQNLPAGRRIQSRDGVERFSFAILESVLPPAMIAEVAAAQAEDAPLALDAIHLMFARMERLLSSRQWWWTPVGPEPQLLELLAEAYGVPQELHQQDPERLARLAAHLEGWHPWRGEVDHAVSLYTRVVGNTPTESWSHVDSAGAEPPALADEVMACHHEEWWAARGAAAIKPDYKISNGMLRFQPSQDVLPLSREDVLVEITPEGPQSTTLLRLIPAWMSARVSYPSTKESR